MNERVPIRCNGELHWLVINEDCHLVPEPRSHDVDLEWSLVELGAPAPPCLGASRHSFDIHPGKILDDSSLQNSMRGTVLALWSKHIDPKVLLGAAVPWLRKALPYYEDVQFRGEKLRKRPREAADLLDLYARGEASTANVGHMDTVLSKAFLNLDSIRSRAFKSWRLENSEEHNAALEALSMANTVMLMARQLVTAAKLDPGAPSPVDPRRAKPDWGFFWGGHRDRHLSYIVSSLGEYISLVLPTSETLNDRDAAIAKERAVDCEQARSIARTAMEHWNG